MLVADKGVVLCTGGSIDGTVAIVSVVSYRRRYRCIGSTKDRAAICESITQRSAPLHVSGFGRTIGDAANHKPIGSTT